MVRFEINAKVRLKTAPDRTGRIIAGPRSVAGADRYRVDFGDDTQEIRADNLEPAEELQAPHELIAQGRFGSASNLRLAITYTRLTGRLADVIYSMEASNTEYLPYQFKPVLNFLDSPSRGILIADEVGLGKTIEAGLIWTELRARYDANRLLVLCPAMLREKWRDELANRFGVRAEILNADELLKRLQKRQREDRSEFAAIASFNALRPPADWELEEESPNARANLARYLTQEEADDDLFDLVIIDEAHYLRNPSTQTHALGRMVRGVSDSLLLLSATPIQLRSDDLYNLLRVLDQENFRHADDFAEVLEANAPLIALASQLRTQKMTVREIRQALERCRQHRLLANNGRLQLIDSDLSKEPELFTPEAREALSDRIERVNLLARVVNRTRKRDVQENRVMREVKAPIVEMTAKERHFYNNVTSIVRQYCAERGLVEAFIQTIPQRQMCSSIPAAFRSWKDYLADVTTDQETAYEDIGTSNEPSSAKEETKPLVRALSAAVSAIADFETLKREDSKYRVLMDSLRQYWSAYPTAKVIIFSYYRGSLRYLNERLREEGEAPLVLVGGMRESKQDLIDGFREDGEKRLLLSSEVASEGVDLQFASFLINYDLPWNPMRVEQRIGRIDRIGQMQAKIQIRNLFYGESLDSRIYNRLFERLAIFRSALGDIEGVLGEKIQELATYLLTHDLTPEEEEERIEQTAMALAANLRTQEELEKEATALAAHGDFVLNKVKAAKELKRYIDGPSLWSYVREALLDRYPGCRLVRVSDDPLTADVSLSQDARVALRSFLERHREVAPTRLSRPTANDVTRCVFSNQVTFATQRHEVMNQHHALVRFITDEIQPESDIYPVSAVHVPWSDDLDVNPGIYLAVAHMWSSRGARTTERLVYEGCTVPDGTSIDPDDVERLMVACVHSGTDWLAASSQLALDDLAGIYDTLTVRLEDRFMDYDYRMRVENGADVTQQLESLRRRISSQIAQKEEIIAKLRAKGRTRMIPANQGHIDKLKSYLSEKERDLNLKRQVSNTPRAVVACIVEVSRDTE